MPPFFAERLTTALLIGESHMSASNTVQGNELMLVGTIGGIAGGLTEIVWISAYGEATGTPLTPVARGIVESTFPALAASPWAPALGILIHFGFAVALGIGLAIVVRQLTNLWAGRRAEFSFSLLILAAVWSVNFLLVLPRINPGFVHLLPYSVTLFSKLLFGLSAAAIFRVSRLRAVPAI
jgi:hypothetical protein